MKAFLPLLLLALLCCRCKNDEPIESCNPHCLMGFVCDPETGECICPEGNILYRGGCVPIKDYMYLPAPDNPNSDCFKYITAMWVDTSSGFSTLLRFKEDTPYGQSYDFNFFPLTTNPDTTSEWAYLQKFVADTKALPCLLDSNQVNAHIYVNFDESIIRMKVEIVPFIATDIIHLLEYPVLESYELVYLRYTP